MCKYDNYGISVRNRPLMRGTRLVSVFHALVVLSALLCCACASFDPNEMCALLPNNTKIKDPRACAAWILCQNGEPLNFTCGASEFYDRQSESCVPAESIECISSNPCAATPDQNGFVADPFSCSNYYYCNNGVPSAGVCPGGYNFNPGTQNCIRNFTCVTHMNPFDYCNIVPDNVFIKNPNNCDGYSLCWQGALLNGTCPSGYYFDPLAASCVNPSEYACSQATTTEPPTTELQQYCTPDGIFISDRRTCDGYYYCRLLADGDYQLIYGTCPAGRFFDASNGGECVPRTQVVCPYDRCAGFGLTGIQLANAAGDDCMGYEICQHGISIGSGRCPNAEYFNEVTQLCGMQVVAFPACAQAVDTTTTSLPEPTTLPATGSTPTTEAA